MFLTARPGLLNLTATMCGSCGYVEFQPVFDSGLHAVELSAELDAFADLMTTENRQGSLSSRH